MKVHQRVEVRGRGFRVTGERDTDDRPYVALIDVDGVVVTVEGANGDALRVNAERAILAELDTQARERRERRKKSGGMQPVVD